MSLLSKQELTEAEKGQMGGLDHLGDEVAHVGQDPPSSEVDFPVA